MPTFAYAGRTRAGESVSGERVADTMDAAVAALKRENINVTRITPAAKEAGKAEKKAGRVEILFHVDKSGRVRVPLVTYSDDPRFAQEAMAAITKWSFSVPKRSGRPSSAFALQRFTFGPRPATNG